MPELPEVETVVRGLRPKLEGRVLAEVEQRCESLRFPLPAGFARRLRGRRVLRIDRRAKYILARLDGGEVLLCHLGMSGRMVVTKAPDRPLDKHDHVVFTTEAGDQVRFNDARRFGVMDLVDEGRLWQHRLLRDLGPEPLGNEFHGNYLWQKSRGRKVSIKQFIMNAHIVVGVGNIYASESLFIAGINPRRAAGRIALHRYDVLADAIKEVLSRAITAGGTTLRDFYGGDGEVGYFQQQLEAYGREDEPCRRCNTPITAITQGQRSTYYCKNCQT